MLVIFFDSMIGRMIADIIASCGMVSRVFGPLSTWTGFWPTGDVDVLEGDLRVLPLGYNGGFENDLDSSF